MVSCQGIVQLWVSCTRLVLVGPTKVKARKSILFTEGTPEVEIKIIRQICRISKDCDQNGDRMSKNNVKLAYLHKATKKYF